MSDHVKRPNRLAEEKSPYLLQHAFNPVNWYPWGEEAFDKAESEDKPIFLSIGYSTCHWCHVMERESFEDEEVAGILNEKYVAIKVDREERPDIDSVYMKVCILVNGTGGWPLTILMTPKKQPFFAGTYLPKSGRYGMPGLVDLLNSAAELWRKDRVRLVSSAEKTVEYLKENAVPKRFGEELGEATLDEGFVNLFDSFDSVNGGFGTRPKFPSPHNLLFLLRYWKRKGRTQALDMVEKTLQRMMLGGIFDQVGFGFHRYSTDSEWLVPHFEKMLYDQAMMCMAYTETYQATNKSEHREAAEEILEYVLRDMVDPEGGFYSAEDADSEGREGKFYLWTEAEIRGLLGRDADLVAKVYNVSEKGNYIDETNQSAGQNILRLNRPLRELAAESEIGFEELESILEKSRRVLFEARERRVHPLKDTKILTDWNGLMIAALAKSSAAFNEPKYAETAEKALKFIIERLQKPNGELAHRYRDGEAKIDGKLEDYAFLIWGLIELYEATFKTDYLAEALRLQRHTIKHFWDATDGGFYLTSDDDEQVLIRNKEFHDSAIPSGNAVSLLNLIRLARMTGETEFDEKAETMKQAFAAYLDNRVSQSTMILVALDFTVGPAYEVVIVGDQQSQTTKEILRTLGTKFIPNKTVLLKSENDEGLEAIAEYTRSMETRNDKTTIYVCKNYACSEPTNDVDKVVEALNE